jgi:hypothetical protein
VIWHVRDYLKNPIVQMVQKEISNYNPDIIHTNNLAGFSVGIWDLAQELNLH